MSANKYKPHVTVIPEDDANSALANGFLLHEAIDLRAIQVLRSEGGWTNVRDIVLSDYVATMKKFPNRHLVLLIDFDGHSDRFAAMTKDVPSDLMGRVFVIGVLSEPEKLLRKQLGSKETIGLNLARECFEQTQNLWNHELLQHNKGELDRMNDCLRPILFPAVHDS